MHQVFQPYFNQMSRAPSPLEVQYCILSTMPCWSKDQRRIYKDDFNAASALCKNVYNQQYKDPFSCDLAVFAY